jgi:hypothetical protein
MPSFITHMILFKTFEHTDMIKSIFKVMILCIITVIIESISKL